MESLIALCLVLLKQLQPFIEQLENTKHQENYQKRFDSIQEDEEKAGQGSIINSLQPPNVLLVAKEDERKLQFLRSEHKGTTATAQTISDKDGAASPYRFQYN